MLIPPVVVRAYSPGGWPTTTVTCQSSEALEYALRHAHKADTVRVTPVAVPPYAVRKALREQTLAVGRGTC